MDKKNETQVKYNTKKVIMLIIFCSAITIFVLTMILSLGDLKSISEVMRSTNIKYLMFAILLLLVYFLLYPITLCILCKSKKIDISPLNAYLIGSTEHFFNGITPFATGGQPFQVYAFKQMGVKLSDSSGILVMNFIIHMIVTNIYALVSLFYYPMLSAEISNLNAMVIIGFGINFFVLLFMISIATSKRIRHGLESILVWLSHFKHLNKFIEPNIPKFNDYCYQTQSAFKELWNHKGAFAVSFVVRFVTMGIYYAITYFILKALHIDVGPEQLPFIICSTAFAITMCVFIPTPGSSGGIEFAFKSIFQAIAVGITTNVAMSGMLLWRSLSYYLVMFISFIIYIVLQQIIVKKVKKEQALAVEMDTSNEAMLEEDTAPKDVTQDSTDETADATYSGEIVVEDNSSQDVLDKEVSDDNIKNNDTNGKINLREEESKESKNK